MKLTREEMTELKMVIRQAIEEDRQMYDEHWLTGKELTKQFGMFSPSWLKTYGKLLPHTECIVTDSNGKHRTTRCYARNKIQKMIATGEIRQLRIG